MGPDHRVQAVIEDLAGAAHQVGEDVGGGADPTHHADALSGGTGVDVGPAVAVGGLHHLVPKKSQIGVRRVGRSMVADGNASKRICPLDHFRGVAGQDLIAVCRSSARYTESMPTAPNPYDWQSHNPRVEIPRADVERIAEPLRQGGSAVVLGGRGMGKSVTLHQIKKTLEQDGSTRVELIPAPPPELTVRACLDELAEVLGVATGAQRSSRILERYFSRGNVPERLVLLFDEFDRYAEKGEPTATPPGRGFFNDLEAARRDVPGLGVMATGSLGIFVVRDVLGSSFLSRALHVRLRPFDRDATSALAAPFAERGHALSDEVLDVLHLATGGIPALLTFGLQALWSLDRDAVERDVTAVYSDFSHDHAAYLQDLLRSVTDPRLSEAPRRVLERIRQASGPVPRARLEEAMQRANGSLSLELIDALQLLEAAGLVHIDGSLFHDNPVRARPIASLLNLPASSEDSHAGHASDTPGELVALLRQDLVTLLGKLHRGSADFFRPGRPKSDGARSAKQLVPESVFAAHLALGFELMGWRVEREAQSASGRTDLKLRRNGSEEILIVEIKIWGRNDYRDAHRQIESYWTAGVRGGAVVQLTDTDVPDWAERYSRECLEPLELEIEVDKVAGSPIHAHLATRSSSGQMARVDHYLLRLPRR